MPTTSARCPREMSDIAAAVRASLAEIVASALPPGAATGWSGGGAEVELAEAIRASTVAVAEWLESGDHAVARAAGQDASRIFGYLAARREVSLTQMTRSCLRWRDAVLCVAREEATRVGAAAELVTSVGEMLHRSCDTTLVRLCAAFEEERRRVNDELARRQEELAHQATHDTLTGLPNRFLVLEEMERSLARAERKGAFVAVLFVDLDDFKDVNDTLGHRAGDVLLQLVAERLAAGVPAQTVLGRLGGDEFVALLDDLPDAETAVAAGERVLAALREPLLLPGLGDRPLAVTASIGVAVAREGSAEDVLRDADVAMYRAKWAGKSRCVLFEPEMQWAARSRLELEMELQAALERGEFFLVYQPTFDLDDMKVTGVEALLRWQHPARGVVEPGEFVPHLERSGLITSVGNWVLLEACRQGAAWQASGHHVAVSVNVSARQLDDPGFVEVVSDALHATGFEPRSLTLEITETAIVADTAGGALRLSAARALGVRIAVDDFGTGYSSLAHLQVFPVDALKIDKSFVSGMLRGREASALVHTLVQLGKALGIETLAEGIEDLSQLAHLRGEQCASGQGFLFAEPLPADEIGAFFTSWSGVAALGAS